MALRAPSARASTGRRSGWRSACAALALLLAACTPSAPMDPPPSGTSESSPSPQGGDTTGLRGDPAKGDAKADNTGTKETGTTATPLDELRALPYAGYSNAPAQDPERRGVVQLDRADSAPGYNLTTFRSLCRSELLTPTGHPLKTWSDSPDCKHWSNSRLLPNGDLLVVGMNQPQTGQRPFDARFVARFSWHGEELLRRALPVHHDVTPGPDGTLFALAAGYREGSDDGSTTYGAPVYDNFLLQLSPDGEVLRRHSLLDLVHRGPFPFSPQAVEPKENQDGVVAVDLFHCNAIVWDPDNTPPLPGVAGREADTVLLTSRHQDALLLVDWRRGELLWAWGQGTLSGPHDGSWLPGGRVLAFDNGLERGWSRGLELDAADGATTWSWAAPEPEDFFTLSRGSIQRLPNGNTLMAESDEGRAVEVTADGRIVWEYLSPYLDPRDRRATIVRMRRHPPELVDALRAGL